MIIRSVPITNTSLNILSYQPNYYNRDTRWQIKGTSNAADRYTITGPTRLGVNIGDEGYASSSAISLDLSQTSSWDSTSPTNYTAASNRVGKDFYIYACKPSSGTVPVFKLSANSTYPSGYSASTSRKLGGFHCLPGDVGTISGHPLSGFVTGDIIPNSVWDLRWRPKCDYPEGMVYDPGTFLWVDIYLASLLGGTGDPYGDSTKKIASVYNQTIYDTDTWFNFVQRGINTGKRLPTYHEFMSLATGSNEQTDIYGGSYPEATGWWSDTAGRAMISHIGVIGACGVIGQWGLGDFSYNRVEGASAPTVSGTATSTEAGKLVDTSMTFDDSFIGCVILNTTDTTWAVILGRSGTTKLELSSDIMASGESYVIHKTSQASLQSGSYKLQTGSKGSIFSYGANNPTVLSFGGSCTGSINNGSRSVYLGRYPWMTPYYVAARYVCDHLNLL